MKDALLAVLEWTSGMGPWGPFCLALIYAAGCVLLVPGSILTLGAGFAFGILRGTLATVIGSQMGLSAAFFLGRTLARGWVERQVERRPLLRALDEAVASEGFKVVLLARLSPVIPFNLLNYFFGITRIPFGKYFLASSIGMLPGTVLYVYLGAGARSLAELASGELAGGTWRYLFLSLGLAATVVLTVALTRIARRALEDVLRGVRAMDRRGAEGHG